MVPDTIDQLKKLAQDIVEQRDMFLVDVQVKHQKVPEVWIYVDVETGGVNLDKCSDISRELGQLLDDSTLITGRYRLNVSSPGLSRPLSDKRQYPKNIGRKAKIKFKREDNYLTSEGVIEEISDENVVLLHENEERTTIDFNAIVETKIIPKI